MKIEKFYSNYIKDELDKYNRSVIALTALITAIWAIVLNVFPTFFSAYFGFGPFYINLMLIYCTFHAIINLFQFHPNNFY